MSIPKVTIQAKLRELETFFVDAIKDLETLLSDSKEKSYGLKGLEYHNKPREEIEAELYKQKREYEHYKKRIEKNSCGWEYLGDVCYLSNKEQKNFNNEMKKDYGNYNLKEYPKEEIFKHINKLIYYRDEIKNLEFTQRNAKRNRILVEPIKELLSVLRYIGDNDQATKPLVKLLSKMEGNHSEKLSVKQREFYHSYYRKEVKLENPPLNLDKIARLKNDYNNEMSKLKTTIKKHKSNYCNDAIDSISVKVNLLKKYRTRTSK